MAEEADYILLREKTATTIVQVSDATAAALFVRMEAKYGLNTDAVFAAAAVEVLEPIWAKATELADYSQNEESEKLGQIADAKKELLDYWQAKLNEATTAAELPKGRRPAFFGLAKAGRRWYP